MATDRRVIFGTYVVPTRIDTMEEDSISKISFLGSTSNDTLSKTLGGKGSAEIDTTQWNDAWTSMFHTQVKWEDLDDTTNTFGNRWEDTYETWNGTLTLGTGGVQLTVDTGIDCGFLYVKNTGSVKNALVSLAGDSGYEIVIPPNGSVCLRGTTDLECNEVYVKASHSDGTTIEWIIAQLTP
jgi:hypothetical protein